MSDAHEQQREAARARWVEHEGNPVVARSAATVAARAGELTEDQAEAVMMAVSRVFPGWIPARSQRAIIAEDREERRQAREAERARAVRAEQAHDAAIAAFAADAELRGDEVSIVGLMNGEGVPTVDQLLQRTRDEQAARDRNAEKWRPGGRKADAIMFEAIPEPAAPAARSAAAAEIANRTRRFRERLAARKRADELDGYR